MRSRSDDRERLRRPWAADAGTVTAEFAVVLPAVLLVVAAALGVLGLATDAIRLADAAGVAARAAGRGDDALMGAAVAALSPGASVEVTRGALVCVRLTLSANLGPLSRAVPLSAQSCAPEAGG
ncbi:hypothetical protein GCM10025867_38770 [Frondihabitans sucicola]|uniref:Pilus assembly protein TadE n=1 Tax=Frondihabitans sucicola TaxID=1268041 RepID=A0ABN6Y3I4_9MICO|nr:TadE family type IV pilus minor pilin [Frondihabitans sucicola]BDZ51636.1 hypothetical protein GCM10025867_38770 [Frondihabitans sucicola]